jgi:heme/copper-type cytochrome/quinol oxidase subunit 1
MRQKATELISTVGAFAPRLGVLVTVYHVIRSFKQGRRAGNDPWHASTLEWLTPSPPRL